MFSKIGPTVSTKYHVQLQKSICCSKKSEGATIGILLKKTCNFVRKRLQYCSGHQRCSIIKGVLLALTQACNFIKKETLALVFSCEFSEIYKNTFFTEHLWWLLLEDLFWKSSVNGCFWKSASQWQISPRKIISDFFYPFKPFVTLNFGCYEKCPLEKCPWEKFPQENCPRKIAPPPSP